MGSGNKCYTSWLESCCYGCDAAAVLAEAPPCSASATAGGGDDGRGFGGVVRRRGAHSVCVFPTVACRQLAAMATTTTSTPPTPTLPLPRGVARSERRGGISWKMLLAPSPSLSH